jgi:PPOX class probable F420-dependent enzyme
VASDLDRLGAEKYVLLTTFRKDGRAVPTPVWVARSADELVVFSAPEAGKIKRIRRDGTVLVAPCTVRGQRRGDDVPGHARLLSETEARQVHDLITKKYGLIGWLTTLGSRIRRRRTGPAGIAIKLD